MADISSPPVDPVDPVYDLRSICQHPANARVDRRPAVVIDGLQLAIP
jgi:hypothetical protein